MRNRRWWDIRNILGVVGYKDHKVGRWCDIRTIRWEVLGYEDQKVGRWWDMRTSR